MEENESEREMEIARMKKREKTLFGSCLGCDIWMDG
jgi:hypothetical protein